MLFRSDDYELVSWRILSVPLPPPLPLTAEIDDIHVRTGVHVPPDGEQPSLGQRVGAAAAIYLARTRYSSTYGTQLSFFDRTTMN